MDRGAAKSIEAGVLELELFGISIAIGAIGSVLGVGGGVFLIPVLTLVFHVPIRLAIGASIVSVIATSSAAGAVYTGKGLTHTRLAMVLEIATTAGALVGGMVATMIGARYLEALFALLLVLTAIGMRGLPAEKDGAVPTGKLDTSYIDPVSGGRVVYGVRNLPAGLAASFLAGNFSGMLGIGGGVVKVPIMMLVMRIPLKAAIATSNFMIGVTAATSALIFYQHDYVTPHLAVPTALGILLGAGLEPRIFGRTRSGMIKRIFQLILIGLAVEMVLKAARG